MKKESRKGENANNNKIQVRNTVKEKKVMKKQNDVRRLSVCADTVFSAFMHVLFDVLTRVARDTSHASVWLFIKKKLKQCANKVNLDGRSMMRIETQQRGSVIK